MGDNILGQLYAEHQGKTSDKWAMYLNEYDKIFASYRHLSIRMLEIGIQNGGSLEVWSRYFPNSQWLIGCDINPDCAKLSYPDERISVVIGDANDDKTYTNIIEKSREFDIIIDDGSHRSSDIVRSFAKYFPHLIDGGVFVVEDLHCSYWKEFEGGLFDPFSSISFFKRLCDITNYEHWGVDKRPGEIFAGFFSKYRCCIEDELLQHVHSVEFLNSMCIIRKAAPGENRIGKRLIAGREALVVPQVRCLDSHEAYPQHDNEWTARALPPDEELPIRMEELASTKASVEQLEQNIEWLDQDIERLEQQLSERDGKLKTAAVEHTELSSALHTSRLRIAELEYDINAIKNSTSWRISKPVRVVKHQFNRVRHLLRISPALIRRGGGVTSTGIKAWKIYRREGLAGIKRGLINLQSTGLPGLDQRLATVISDSYAEWVRQYDTLTDDTRKLMVRRMEEFIHRPTISVVMPTYNAKPEWLVEVIESVRGQIYSHWELCIADDASTDPAIRPILERYAEMDSRIKLVFRQENGHISAASNSALALASGEWTALLDHDDLLPQHALFWVVNAINDHPDVRMIYSDEDKIDETGARFDPYFKCDWNPDLFYSHNMFCHFGVYQTGLLRDIGGFRVGFEGAQDYDLTLRCVERVEPRHIVHIPRVLYHWRRHAESTAQSASAKPYAVNASERALAEHFERRKVSVSVKYAPPGYRVKHELPPNLPMVSLIIPTRNGLHLIRQCVTSILKKTTYPNYEILVIDNGSDDPATLDYFREIECDARIRVIRDERPFNYSALNNAAVKLALGEIVGLVNNDIEVISPDWLFEMVSHAVRTDIGAVGARLWYPDDTLQHGGVILGIGGVAGHSHKKLKRGQFGYLGRAALIQNLSAVTAACLLIRKKVYEEVGGLNEVDLQVAFNDVDFCLRVREAGYRNLWTPYAELYHHESATRGFEDTPKKQARFAKEVSYMQERWGDCLLHDPAYSPNLTLLREDFGLAWPPQERILTLSEFEKADI